MMKGAILCLALIGMAIMATTAVAQQQQFPFPFQLPPSTPSQPRGGQNPGFPFPHIPFPFQQPPSTPSQPGGGGGGQNPAFPFPQFPFPFPFQQPPSTPAQPGGGGSSGQNPGFTFPFPFPFHQPPSTPSQPSGGGSGGGQNPVPPGMSDGQRQCYEALHDNRIGSCITDLVNTLVNHQVSISSGCCSLLTSCQAVGPLQNPFTEQLISRYCS